MLTARRALNMLLNDDTADVEQTTLITAARETLAEAEAAQTEAHNALYAATGPDRDGSIYRAGVAEWRAKGAVEKAIGDWNTAVTEFTTADTALTSETSTFGDYVPLQNSGTTAGQILSLLADPADAESAPNLANLRTYANAEGGSESTQNSTTGAITGSSNFDAAGNLLVPLSDADSDADTPLTPSTSDQTYSTINTQLTQVNNVVTALEKLQSENQNALLQAAIDEAVRRAKLEQAHFQTQFDALVADNTDLDTGTDGVQSFKSMYDAVRMAMTKRANAGVTLETAVETREAATKAVRAAFTNPQSFYQQLVDRRQYLKDEADMEVTRLAGLTGDDAPTAKQTEDAAMAAADAKTAVDDAQATLDSFQGLFEDDNPVGDLVRELLKPDTGDDAGDDGQALVDAISGSYDAADAAMTTADEAKTTADQVAEDVKDLTGDEGAVNVNTKNIEANTKSIDGIEAEVWGDASTDGMSRIDANEMRSQKNEMAIFDEAGNSRIAMNELAIQAGTMEIYGSLDTSGESRIDANETRSMGNETRSMANETRSMANSGRLDVAEAAIRDGAQLIAGNTASIGENRSSIMRNADMIGGLQDQMEIVRAGVAASMALAGMPAINGRGISIGVGSFDGESAFAVGFQIQSDMASFKVGVTSAGGETGASAGVGFQF